MLMKAYRRECNIAKIAKKKKQAPSLQIIYVLNARAIIELYSIL
jgi:hypothetical protein